MNENDIIIENRLREMRQELRLSQEAVAEALGVSRQSVIALEQGKYLPSLPIAISICKFFNRAFEDIFEFEREMAESEVPEHHPIAIKVINESDQIDQLRKEGEMNSDLEPWRPFREAISLRDAVDRLLTDSVISPRAVAGGLPRIDIKENKENFVVKAEIPGVVEEDIDVEVTTDGMVTISGEKKEEREESKEGEGYYYRETSTGTFSRTFSLPTDVMADQAVADVENGILKLTIPKARPEKTQKVKVSAKKK